MSSIKEDVADLLCEVKAYCIRYKDEWLIVDKDHLGAKTMGLTYAEVLHRLAELHPGSRCDNAALRWYANRIKTEAEPLYEFMMLPDVRPRPGKDNL